MKQPLKRGTIGLPELDSDWDISSLMEAPQKAERSKLMSSVSLRSSICTDSHAPTAHYNSTVIHHCLALDCLPGNKICINDIKIANIVMKMTYRLENQCTEDHLSF